MPPPLALALSLLFIFYLFRRDAREGPKISWAVWLPTIWLSIIASRPVSIWLDPGSGFDAQRLEDGNAVDKAVYGALIIAGITVLVRRRVRLGEIVRNNLAISLFLLYEGLSVVWSDYPLVAFKRWGKALGDPIMVLVLCTDLLPARAINAAIKRSAYVLITLSVLFCKYYEHLGRGFDGWGRSFYTGVTTNKNMMGYILFAFGLFFVASLLSGRVGQEKDRKNGGSSAGLISLVFVIMVVWLLPLADSQTATLSLFAGIGVVVASKIPVVRRHFWIWAVLIILLGTMLEASCSISGNVVEGAGRDTTFTGRTGLWETVLNERINPLVGVGYASFWLGERLQRFWAMYPTSPPTQAHNGYLEAYLNLGVIGLFLLAGVLWAGLRQASRRLAVSGSESHDQKVLRTFGIGYVVAYLLYNVTEATFQGLNPLFVIFMVLLVEYQRQSTHVPSPSGVVTGARGQQRVAVRALHPMRGAR